MGEKVEGGGASDSGSPTPVCNIVAVGDVGGRPTTSPPKHRVTGAIVIFRIRDTDTHHESEGLQHKCPIRVGS